MHSQYFRKLRDGSGDTKLQKVMHIRILEIPKKNRHTGNFWKVENIFPR